MEDAEAYNNLTLTSQGDDSIIQLRIEETKKLIQKLSQEKFEITTKMKEKTFDRNHICNRLERLSYHEEGIRETMSRLRKELDILEMCEDKLHFANNAYQVKPMSASFSNQQLDNHTWWWHRSLRYEKDQKKAKDGLREIKQHEWCRDRAIANATVKGQIWNSLGSKKALRDQIEVLRTDLEESRKRHLEIRANITSVKKELKGVDREFNFLKKQIVDIDRKKLEAHLLVHA
ncbi:hypothetical protein FEM48_Zijuj06G0054000 [Ziziphus jujuba var. spinosa]|uniref:Uncharacterized protein n=1 Tax=Ziziphus jujuba var. spinosa TaxID=714518 RepID=A0A978V7E9_ZIZJJ|nr:hypothetical protein FEM48_Zijuj06G0054000 [Ziziphus jujuba var. spinosa]